MIGKKNIFIGLSLTCLLIAPISGASIDSAADWPMFHNNLDHTSYLDKPSDFSPQTWIFKTGWAILSGPAISEKLLYLGSANGTQKYLAFENTCREC